MLLGIIRKSVTLAVSYPAEQKSLSGSGGHLSCPVQGGHSCPHRRPTRFHWLGSQKYSSGHKLSTIRCQSHFFLL